MRWPFDDSYARDLTGLYADVSPTPVAEPRLLALNEPLAADLGLDVPALRTPDGVPVLAGNAVPEESHPIAEAYAGHQFGQFAGVLGDGRAVLLGELADTTGTRRDLALKGSGRTPFSRGGDGRAAIGPVLREYLVSEAMHALGIPTTRSLAAVATGEVVLRQPPEPGAVLTRVASSHLRVGTFELVRVTGDPEHVRRLAAYARERHFPDIATYDEDPLALLSAVAEQQASLIAQWLAVGFIHGVMNTDNMAISGETIDYGPCAFLEAHDPHAVFSSIDGQGRYRYGAQPSIAAWNLARLAECLIAPLGEDGGPVAVEDATQRLHAFVEQVRAEHSDLMIRKIGLAERAEGDEELVADLLTRMEKDRLDHTLTFRRLARVLRGEAEAARGHALDLAAWDEWQERWLTRVGGSAEERTATAEAMDAINPLYIPRNHLVEEALEAARKDDLEPFEALLAAVRDPFTERPGLERYAEPAPAGFIDTYRTFCGT
ncbi:YdiU family protein [Nocardioides rotundus]|uniref:protein adenylyltransferase SelO n=1 Tax=Nocardioides rotundus TaxID=1774216 RepID=UPI001CC12065|nr:YdiU family protein [Nocardioides rotundus]UAL31118.1 YdiU family protein [Nocardioides rotundus]